MAKVAGKQSLLNRAAAGKQPADDPTGTGLEEQLPTIRPVQALKKTTADGPAGTGLAAKQQPQMLAGLSPCSAGWWREYDGAGHSKGGLRPTLPVSLPPIAFACLRQYPLPYFGKTQFSPNLFFLFLFLFYFYFPTINRPLTPFIVLVRLTYRHRAYSQPLHSLPRRE